MILMKLYEDCKWERALRAEVYDLDLWRHRCLELIGNLAAAPDSPRRNSAALTDIPIALSNHPQWYKDKMQNTIDNLRFQDYLELKKDSQRVDCIYLTAIGIQALSSRFFLLRYWEEKRKRSHDRNTFILTLATALIAILAILVPKIWPDDNKIYISPYKVQKDTVIIRDTVYKLNILELDSANARLRK